jgi:hypothetical protein
MANINIENISDLALSGNNLFEDSESFMTELSDEQEEMGVYGGAKPICLGKSCVNSIKGCGQDTKIPVEFFV